MTSFLNDIFITKFSCDSASELAKNLKFNKDKHRIRQVNYLLLQSSLFYPPFVAMECEDSIPIPPAIPDELLRKIFSFVSHDNRSEVERVNSQFYEVMCESQRKNTGLRIEYGYVSFKILHKIYF